MDNLHNYLFQWVMGIGILEAFARFYIWARSQNGKNLKTQSVMQWGQTVFFTIRILT